MKKNALLLSAASVYMLCLVFVLATGCKKNVTEPGPPTPTNPTPPPGIDDAKVNAGIRGIVVDANNLPVLGATVTSGTQTTTTDHLGQFHFKNIMLSKNNGYVKVSKAGYFHGSRSFFTTAGRTHMVRIVLLQKTTTGSFAATSGGTVNLTGGAKLVMPADAITDTSGVAYTGTVNVAMTWIDPTSAKLPDIIPGDLRGITTNGEERGLQTFGMLGVELTGGAQPLKLAANKTAELTFPIPASLGASAPATIDLWHFDEVTGRWRQEGTATKTGSYYIANVKHFSFWNCDVPFPLVEVCMTIVGPNTAPLNNVQVRIKRTDGSAAYARTDSAGNLCGKVPKNEALVLEVMDQCGNVMGSQNIGPFSSNTNLGTIATTLTPATGQVVITGTVKNCSGGDVMDGVVVLYVNGGNTYTAAIDSGKFSLTLLFCTAPISFSLTATDFATLQESVPVSGTTGGGITNVGAIQACGTAVPYFVQTIVDGMPETYTEANAMLGSANDPPVPPWLYKTRLGAQTPVIGYGMTLTFSHSGTPGNYSIPLLQSLMISRPLPISGAWQIVSPNPVVTLTEFGPSQTGAVAGHLSVQMTFPSGTRNVNASFRVKRW